MGTSRGTAAHPQPQVPQGFGLGTTAAVRLMATGKPMPTRTAPQKPMWFPAEAKTRAGPWPGRSTDHSVMGVEHSSAPAEFRPWTQASI